MKFDRLFLIVALTTLLCARAVMTARADVITDWNDKVVTAGVKERPGALRTYPECGDSACGHVRCRQLDRSALHALSCTITRCSGTSREAAAASRCPLRHGPPLSGPVEGCR